MSDRAYFEYLKARSWTGLLYRRYMLYPRLVRHLSGHVLDVGCGLGDFLEYRPGTTGVDVNRHAVAWCRDKGLDVHPMQPDILPFGNESFDGVVLDNVLEHIARPQPLLAEIARILAPPGRFVVGVPGRRGYAADSDHKVFYDEATLVRTVADHGFSPIEAFHMPLRSVWLDRRMRQYCVYGVFGKR